METDAATLLRQSGNILDIAQAICQRSNRILGHVNQYRVHMLMKGLCRVRHLVQTRSHCRCCPRRMQRSMYHCQIPCFRRSSLLPRGVRRGTRLFTALQPLTCFVSPSQLSVAWHRRMHFHHGFFYDLLSKIAVRSDNLCILVSGLVDTFVTAFNLKFQELMCGGIKMILAQRPSWAHTYQSMCSNSSADQLRPAAFRLPKPTKRCSMLPSWRTTTRMIGIDSSGWRLFSDGSFQRQPDGSELAGWGIAAVSRENVVRILCGLSRATLAIWRF